MSLNTSAIIVAAGSGKRMGLDRNKLFLEVAGLPIIQHTWRRIDQAPEITEVILVIRDDNEEDFESVARVLQPTKPYRYVVGGKERQDSVSNGIAAASPENKIILIHDGARPCASPDLVSATIVKAASTGAAVAASRVVDTIKSSEDGQTIGAHLDRSTLWAVQTPQTFQAEVIKKALAAVKERGLSITDDTAACELIGQPVSLIAWPDPNPKATSPSDLPYLEILLT